MKKGKIILGAMAAIVAVGSGLAFKAKAFSQRNIWQYTTTAGSCIVQPLSTVNHNVGSITIPTTGYYTVSSCNGLGHELTVGSTVYNTSNL